MMIVLVLEQDGPRLLDQTQRVSIGSSKLSLNSSRELCHVLSITCTQAVVFPRISVEYIDTEVTLKPKSTADKDCLV